MSISSEAKRWAHSHPLGPIPRLTYRLFRAVLWTGPTWFLRLLRLILFGILLTPVWIRIGWFYVTSPNIRRNVRYGSRARNFLDIFFPDQVLGGRRCPVVVLISGGAWIIGYKAWGVFVARILMEYGLICVLVDYRNFPQGTAKEMVQDVNQAMNWIYGNISKYGGDYNHIYVVGQSAGAHLFANALLNQSEREADYLRRSIDPDELSDELDEGYGSYGSAEETPSDWRRASTNSLLRQSSESPLECESYPSLTPFRDASGRSTARLRARLPWRSSKLRAFIGLSGPYDLIMFRDYFHSQGLHRSVQDAIFGVSVAERERLSPTLRVASQEFHDSHAAECLPPIYLLHGDADVTCPSQSSNDFAAALRKLESGPKVLLRIYGGKSHTDPIIEDLLHTEFDDSCDVLADILRIVLGSVYPDSPDSTPAPLSPSPSRTGIGQRKPVSRRKSRLRPLDTLGFYDDPLNPPSLIAAQTMLPHFVIAWARWINPF